MENLASSCFSVCDGHTCPGLAFHLLTPRDEGMPNSLLICLVPLSLFFQTRDNSEQKSESLLLSCSKTAPKMTRVFNLALSIL